MAGRRLEASHTVCTVYWHQHACMGTHSYKHKHTNEDVVSAMPNHKFITVHSIENTVLPKRRIWDLNPNPGVHDNSRRLKNHFFPSKDSATGLTAVFINSFLKSWGFFRRSFKMQFLRCFFDAATVRLPTRTTSPKIFFILDETIRLG
jgi:hypothetical protein